MQKHISALYFSLFILLSLALTSEPIYAEVGFITGASSTNSSALASTTLIIDKPPGTVFGDGHNVMIAAISTTFDIKGTAPPPLVTPSGWTPIPPPTSGIEETTAGGKEINSRLSIFYKVVTNPETASSYTWPIAANVRAVGIIATFSGVAVPTDAGSPTPIYVSDSAQADNKTLPLTPIISTPFPYSMLLTIFEAASSVDWASTTSVPAVPAMAEITEVAFPDAEAKVGISMQMNYLGLTAAGDSPAVTGNYALTKDAKGPSLGFSILLRPYINTIDHYQIQHDGAGLTCDSGTPEYIYVQACHSAGDCSEPHNSDVPGLTVQDVNFPGTGSITTYTYTSGTTLKWNENKKVELSEHITTATIGLKVFSATTPTSCTTLTGVDSTCNMLFNNGALTFTSPTLTSCNTSANIAINQVANDGNLLCATTAGTTDSGGVKYSISPAPPVGTGIVINKGTATEITLSSIASTTIPGTQTGFTLNHDNAGQYTLKAELANDPSIAGSTTFTVKPDSFFLQANNTSGASLNNASAAGTPIWKAGEDFRLKLRGQCADGTITTNYKPENAEMWVELALPNPGETGTEDFTIGATATTLKAPYPTNTTAPTSWANISNKFSDGAITDGTNTYVNAAFHEVGVIKLHVRDSDYFGTTIDEKLIPLTVGRFTPHHFDTLVTTHGCDDTVKFGYSGQPFRMSVTARNKGGTTTKNYAGDFAKLTTISDAGDDTRFSNNTILGAAFPAVHSAVGAGSFQTADPINDAANAIKYNFTPANANTPPYDLELTARDTDSGTTALAEAFRDSTQIRSGRLSLDTAVGPVSDALFMTLSSEYYKNESEGFVFNVDDSCTAYEADTTTTGASLVNWKSHLSDGETTVSGAGTLNSGLSCTELNDPSDPANYDSLKPDCLAAEIITFTKPNDKNGNNDKASDGKVNLLLNNFPAWFDLGLKYDPIDCDGIDGVDVKDYGACGTAIFGIYQGDTRVIYWREIF